MLCKGSQHFRAQQYKFAICPPEKTTKNYVFFQIATLIQCASAQPFIPKGYSFESVSKSEPLMRIIKYAVGFAHK